MQERYTVWTVDEDCCEQCDDAVFTSKPPAWAEVKRRIARYRGYYTMVLDREGWVIWAHPYAPDDVDRVIDFDNPLHPLYGKPELQCV